MNPSTQSKSKPSKRSERQELPADFLRQLGLTLGALKAISNVAGRVNPYTTAELANGSKRVEQWMVGYSKTGRATSSEIYKMQSLLRGLEVMAHDAVHENANFQAQFEAHLRRIVEKLDLAVGDRTFVPSLAAAFNERAGALKVPLTVPRTAEEMTKLFQAANDLEQGVDKKLAAAVEGKRRIKLAGFRA